MDEKVEWKQMPPGCFKPMPNVGPGTCVCYLDEGHEGECVCGWCDDGDGKHPSALDFDVP